MRSVAEGKCPQDASLFVTLFDQVSLKNLLRSAKRECNFQSRGFGLY
jgi:hypothetical protein